MAGNKNDMYEYEEVPEAEAKNYAKELGAIFQTTSAKVASGIDDLFSAIGKKFLDPSFSEDNQDEKKDRIALNNQTQDKEDKKKCC